MPTTLPGYTNCPSSTDFGRREGYLPTDYADHTIRTNHMPTTLPGYTNCPSSTDFGRRRLWPAYVTLLTELHNELSEPVDFDALLWPKIEQLLSTLEVAGGRATRQPGTCRREVAGGRATRSREQESRGEASEEAKVRGE